MAIIRIDWDPSPQKLRNFGLGLFFFSFLVGGLMLWRGNPAGPCVLGLGILLSLLTLGAPALGRRIYKAWMWIAFIIGTATSFLVLGFLYYGILTPLALFFRIRGRDELRLIKPDGPSYWIPIELPADMTYYERLF